MGVALGLASGTGVEDAQPRLAATKARQKSVHPSFIRIAFPTWRDIKSLPLDEPRPSLFIVLWRCVTVITQHFLGNVFHGKSQRLSPSPLPAKRNRKGGCLNQAQSPA